MEGGLKDFYFSAQNAALFVDLLQISFDQTRLGGFVYFIDVIKVNTHELHITIKFREKTINFYDSFALFNF